MGEEVGIGVLVYRVGARTAIDGVLGLPVRYVGGVAVLSLTT